MKNIYFLKYKDITKTNKPDICSVEVAQLTSINWWAQYVYSFVFIEAAIYNTMFITQKYTKIHLF